MFEVNINDKKSYFTTLSDAVVFLKRSHQQHIYDNPTDCTYFPTDEELRFEFSIRECSLTVEYLEENRFASIPNLDLSELKADAIHRLIETTKKIKGGTIYYDR